MAQRLPYPFLQSVGTFCAGHISDSDHRLKGSPEEQSSIRQCVYILESTYHRGPFVRSPRFVLSRVYLACTSTQKEVGMGKLRGDCCQKGDFATGRHGGEDA